MGPHPDPTTHLLLQARCSSDGETTEKLEAHKKKILEERENARQAKEDEAKAAKARLDASNTPRTLLEASRHLR